MKHIHWLIPGKNHNIASIKNFTLASVRLRTYVSSINTNSYTFSFGEDMPLKTDILVIGKIGNFDLEKRAANWFKQIKMCKITDAKVILDYTDNHLIINSPFTKFYKAILPFVDIIITPSDEMSSILKNLWRGPIKTINDSIDVEVNKWTQDKNGNKLLWFGHPTNIIYLFNFLKTNQKFLKQYSIIIITSQIGIDYFNKLNDPQVNLDISTKLWSTNMLINEAKTCDICVIPSDKRDPKKKGAGHNRLITALALGMPVIATTLPAYAEFKDYFIDENDEKITDVLKDPNIMKDKVLLAQKKIVPTFNKIYISKKWHKVFNGLKF